MSTRLDRAGSALRYSADHLPRSRRGDRVAETASWSVVKLCEDEQSRMKQPWRAKAACNGLDPTIFYPPSDDDEDAAQAKAVCAVCSVQSDCLEHALGFREKEGIWGAATERERRRLIRQRRRAAYAAAAEAGRRSA